MRRIGMGLVIAGLIALLAAVTFAELLAARSRAEPYLQTMFYAGAAMCLAGALLFTVRVLIARRRR